MGDELRYSLKKFTCWSGHLTQCFQDLFDFICTSLSALNSHFALFKTTRVHRRRLWSEFFFRCSRLWARSIQPKISGNLGPKLSGSVRSNRKSFEKTGPPFEVVHFSRSDRSACWLNGSRPMSFSASTIPYQTKNLILRSPM